MQSVTLIENVLEPETWSRHEVEDVREFLVERFEEWPSSARIYHGQPAQDRDVTPATERDVERLATFEDLTVIVYPGDPITAIIAIGAIILGVMAAMLIMPKIPSLENQQSPSPNNGLSERTNRARPNGRIPDIFGTVRAVPDLIAAPYRVYENHREVEIAYLCLGRGEYEVSDIRDGDTLISKIAGASVEVYAPYTSPNDGEDPQVLIGTSIGDPVFNVVRLNEVNGQTLIAPNDRAIRSRGDIRFVDGGIIRAASGTMDFTEYFTAGDFVDVGKATDPGGDAGSDAIMAAATATASGFTFATYNPTPDFQVGQFVSVTGAVYQVDDAVGGAGTITGGTTYPDFPYNPYVQSKFERDIGTEP